MHRRFLTIAAAGTVAATGAVMPAQAQVTKDIQADIAQTWARFNTGLGNEVNGTGDGNVDRIRTNVFDGLGARQPWLKFEPHGSIVNQAIPTLIKAEVILTVRSYDTEDGFYEWDLFGVNDGVTNEDFEASTPFNLMPGILENQTPIYSAQDPAETTNLGGVSLLLDDADIIPNAGDPRPQPGDEFVFDVTPFVALDTNGVFSFLWHQTNGENINFRPEWHGEGAGTLAPTLRLTYIPSPTAAFGGLGLLGAVAMRRRRA